MKMALPRYPRQSGAFLRDFGSYGQQQQAGPCWTDDNGVVNCPPGYHIDSQTGRVVADKQDVDWKPIVEAGTGVVLAIVNAATGKQYNYPAGQQPRYQQGAVYAPPWYETIPTWAWLLGGGVLVGVAFASRR